MTGVTEQAVDDALAALIARQRDARETFWACPFRAQVRAMLEGAFPGLVTAAARVAAEMERADAAEARLAAIAEECRPRPGAGGGLPGEQIRANRILAIIGGEEAGRDR